MSKSQPTRWLRVSIALIGLTMIGIAFVSNMRTDEPDTAVDTQQRMPIRNPILESDRPDLLSEPGMESIDDDTDRKPGSLGKFDRG